MSQILAILNYVAVVGNVALGAVVAAAPPDHPVPWWVIAVAAGVNAAVHAVPGPGLPINGGAVKAALIGSLVFLGLSLGACTGQSPAQVAATVTTDISSGVAAACSDAATAAKLFPTSPVAVYATAACPAGTAAASLVQNSATIQWLGQIIGQLQQGAPSTPPAPAAPAVAPAKSG